MTEVVKSFWIKAKMEIINSEHRVYYLACPNCSKVCGAAYKYEFTCFYCNQNFPSPKPLLRFQIELYDGTGCLQAYVEHKEAQMLLGMSGEEIIENEEEETPFSPDDVNQKFKDLQFLFQIRTSRNEFKGRSFVRNTIITCLPAAESSSTSHSSGEKTSSLHVQSSLLADVAMTDSQESTSKMQGQHLKIDPVTQLSTTSSKRRLEHKENVTEESSKHSKQD